MPITTIEQAQERILELEGQVTELTTERDSLSQNNAELAANLENARKFNQKLFERLSVQTNDSPDEEDETEVVPTCEEFANTIHII